jgi:hypothetical protein
MVALWRARSASSSLGGTGGAGDDDGLGELGQRELAADRGGGGRERRHAGDDLVGDAELLEAAHLLGGGAEQRRIAGVDAGDVVIVVACLDEHRDDLVEGQTRRVHDLGVGAGAADDLGGDQRAGVEDDRAASDELGAAHGEEAGVAGAGADDVDAHRDPLPSCSGGRSR